MKLTSPLKIAIVGISLLLVAAIPGSAAEHPSLVKTDSEQCLICHEDLTERMPVIHSPVTDSCDVCHELSRTEDGTTVQLADSEPDLCLMCHSELEDAVAMELEASHPAVEDSCLSCHLPHASENPKLLSAGVTDLCANCHDLDDLAESHDGQITPATNCSTCHAPHGSEHPKMLLASKQHAPFAEGSCAGCHREPFGPRTRLRARGARLCTACHGEFEEHEGGSLHQALLNPDRNVRCLACHDPHMSANPALLRRPGPSMCADCHADLVTNVLRPDGHAAAADDCTACHAPHTSEYPHLLTTEPDELCAMCHDLDDEDLTATHLGADLNGLECTSCHSPHGEGHPSLLARSYHPAIEDGCELCHEEGTFDQLAEDGSSELCLMCHDDIGEMAQSAAVPHEAMFLDTCTICHNPHASPQRKLLTLPDGGPCADCHSDQFAENGETQHGIIEWVGCEACHEPHGSANEKLLKGQGAELCLTCHDYRVAEVPAGLETVELADQFEVPADKVRKMKTLVLSQDGQHNHPVVAHRTLGVPTEEELKESDTTFNEELTCLTCHTPHKGGPGGLFQWGAASSMEVCQQCHEK